MSNDGERKPDAHADGVAILVPDENGIGLALVEEEEIDPVQVSPVVLLEFSLSRPYDALAIQENVATPSGKADSARDSAVALRIDSALPIGYGAHARNNDRTCASSREG